MINKISELRKLKGISQFELAANVGVFRQTISSLKTYKFYPTLKLAYKIANYFNKNIEEVFQLNNLEESKNA